ncbi:Linear gramicidin dehydrogenase LgrE [Corynebacterium occultum]|uniref:Thioesterase TesA n=1 Tax=Corynebacterium occultum TaxID=2675219 RepID=A0A6B8VR33_9CORY|nr:alpha/beta fold hydrolase [Corynebacterium occultum]QGU08012.1 Linear gramicidin dehydrogenase LgrE [Corynebacterium occultum]
MSTAVLVELSAGENPLICFPPAGAGASYFRFLAQDRAVSAVQYPGRESRFREPFATSRPELLKEITAHLALLPNLGQATFLGHSLGATLAFESALGLQRLDLSPARVVLSARNNTPPGTSPKAPDGDATTDEELKEWLLGLGGTRPEVLAHPELAELILKVARADLRLGAQGGATGLIDAPILTLCGDHDPAATTADMAGWAERTTAAFHQVTLNGDHDALRHNPQLFIELLEEKS